MVAAAERSDAVAMVAYMKRYDPAYERAQELLEDFDEIDLVTAYDIDLDHSRIIDEVYDLVNGTLPEGLLEESVTERREQLQQAIGTADEFLVDAYDFQLDYVCHDVNALRGLFGRVERIRDVDVIGESCTCPDWQQRSPAGGCKHLRRVDHEIKRGRVPRPDGRLPADAN